MPKRPAFQWYPGDFKRDTALQSCSFYARSIWREMLDLMHDGEPYGYLTANGEPISIDEFARMIGEPQRKVHTATIELERKKVFSRTDEGVIYSRRMIRDEATRTKRAAGGKLSLMHPDVPRPKGGRHKDTTKDTLAPSLDTSLGGSPASASASASAITDKSTTSNEVGKPSFPQSPKPTTSDEAEPSDGDLMALVRKRFYVPDGKPPADPKAPKGVYQEGREFSCFKHLRKLGYSGQKIADQIEGAALIRDDNGLVTGQLGRVDWLEKDTKLTMRALIKAGSGVTNLWQLAEIKLAEHDRALGKGRTSWEQGGISISIGKTG